MSSRRIPIVNNFSQIINFGDLYSYRGDDCGRDKCRVCHAGIISGLIAAIKVLPGCVYAPNCAFVNRRTFPKINSLRMHSHAA